MLSCRCCCETSPYSSRLLINLSRVTWILLERPVVFCLLLYRPGLFLYGLSVPVSGHPCEAMPYAVPGVPGVPCAVPGAVPGGLLCLVTCFSGVMPWSPSFLCGRMICYSHRCFEPVAYAVPWPWMALFTCCSFRAESRGSTTLANVISRHWLYPCPILSGTILWWLLSAFWEWAICALVEGIIVRIHHTSPFIKLIHDANFTGNIAMPRACIRVKIVFPDFNIHNKVMSFKWS